jgi:hypothetical protein
MVWGAEGADEQKSRGILGCRGFFIEKCFAD